MERSLGPEPSRAHSSAGPARPFTSANAEFQTAGLARACWAPDLTSTSPFVSRDRLIHSGHNSRRRWGASLFRRGTKTASIFAFRTPAAIRHRLQRASDRAAPPWPVEPKIMPEPTPSSLSCARFVRLSRSKPAKDAAFYVLQSAMNRLQLTSGASEQGDYAHSFWAWEQAAALRARVRASRARTGAGLRPNNRNRGGSSAPVVCP